MSANGAAHDHSSGSPRGDGLRVPTSPTSGAHKASNTGGGASQPRPPATEKPATAPPGAGAASGSPAPAAAEHYVDVAPTADGGLTGEVLAKWRTSMELLPRYVATSKVVVFVSDLLVRQTLLLDLTLRHHESHKTGRKSVFDLITTNEDVFRTQRLARVLLKAGSPSAPRNLPDVGVVIHFEPPDTDAYVRRLSWAPKGVSILLLMPSQTEVVAALKGAGRNLSVLPGAPGQANAKTGWGEGAETSSTPQPTLSELSDPRPGVSDLLRALGTFPSPPLAPAPQQASKPAHTPSQSHSHAAKSAPHPPQQQQKKPAAVKAQEVGEAAVGGGEGKGGAADAEGAQQQEQAGAGGGEDEAGDAEGGAADGEGEKRENGWQTVTAQKERNVRGNHDLGDGSIGKARLDVKKQVRVGDELNGEVLTVQRGESRGGGEGGERQQTQRQVTLRVGKPEGVYSEEARLTPTIELPVGEKLRVRVVSTDKGAKGTHIRVTPATEFPVGDSELDLSRLRKFDVLNGLVVYPLDNRGVTLRVGTPEGFYPIRATILQWPPKVRIGQGIKVEVRHIREDKSYIKVQQVDPDLLIARTPELLPTTLEVGKVLNACAYTQNDTSTFLRIGTTEGMYVAHGVLPKDIGLVPIGERAKVEVTGINEEAGGRLSVNLKLHKPT